MNEFVLLILIVVAFIMAVLVFFDFDHKLEKKEDHIVGKLIVIEGIEGSGKNKLIELMKEHLPTDWAYTKEPYFAVDGTENWTKENYQLDRENHVQSKILPLLQQNRVVITNRYWMSGCVYDGWQAESYLSIWPDPDLVIWLDCEPEEEEAKAEHVTVAVLQELRKSYQTLFDQLNKEHHIKIKKINTDNLSSEELLTIVNEEVEKIIPAPKNPEPILTAYQV